MKKLQSILNPTSKPCLTIYIPHKSESFSEAERKDLFLKLLTEAESILIKEYTRSFVNSFIEKLWLANPFKELEKHKSALGFFHNSERTDCLAFESDAAPKVVVADSFHIKPILSWLQETPPYWLVTLTSTQARIFKGDAWELTLVKVVSKDKDEKRNSFSSKDDTFLFLDQVANEFIPLYKEDPKTLLLGGLDWIQTSFREKIKIKNVLTTEIKGNTHLLSLKELRHFSLSALKKTFKLLSKNIIFEFREKMTSPKILTDLGKILEAIKKRKVRKILIASDRTLWGELSDLRINPMQKNSKDDDILDDIAEKALASGASVMTLPKKDILDGRDIVALVS